MRPALSFPAHVLALDGSWAPGTTQSGWAVVAADKEGLLWSAYGIADNVHSALEAEAIALLEALGRIPADGNAALLTDSRMVANVLQGRTPPTNLPRRDLIATALDQAPKGWTLRWKAASSVAQRMAHHLANAARLEADLNRLGTFIPATKPLFIPTNATFLRAS